MNGSEAPKGLENFFLHLQESWRTQPRQNQSLLKILSLVFFLVYLFSFLLFKKLYLFYGILCHDFGKPFCTKEINGKITSHKHENLGIEPTISFLSKLTNEKKFIEIVCSLVKNHLAPFQLYKIESSLKAVKRLSLKVNIEDLCLVCLSDCLGRTIKDKEKCPNAISWLLNKAKELDIHNVPIKPLVQGRDLIKLGFNPSDKFKEILEFAFDLQLDFHLEKELIIKKIIERY